MILRIDVALEMEVSDALNNDLEQGSPRAMTMMEEHLRERLNTGQTSLRVPRLKLMAMGPHNTTDIEAV